MAKLDVKVIDMVGGEVTKVEYAGETYVKTGKNPQTGDIGLRLHNDLYYSARVGNYYRIDMRKTDVGYIGEDGDFDTTSRASNFAYFRKTSAASTPIAEEVEKRVDALEQRMENVEKAVKAEDDELAPGTACLGKKTGKYYVIGKRHPDRDYRGDKAYMDISGEGFHRASELEPVTPIEGPAQVGDKIVIVAAEMTRGQYKNGDVLTVRKVDEDGDVRDTNKTDRLICMGEFVIVERPVAKPYKDSAYVPSEGDIVVITANTNSSRNNVGDIGKVEITGGESFRGKLARVHVPGKTAGNGNNTLYSEMRPATPTEIAQYEKDVAKANKPQVGDYVRAVKNIAEPRCDSGYTGYGKRGQGVVRIGEIGRVTKILSDRIVIDFEGAVGTFSVGSRRKFELIDGEYVKATEEVVDARKRDEAKRKERAITEELAKYDRKPGEFKKGDIVAYDDPRWFENSGIGEVVDEAPYKPLVRGCGKGCGITTYYLEVEKLTLITPVEARLDRIAVTA